MSNSDIDSDYGDNTLIISWLNWLESCAAKLQQNFGKFLQIIVNLVGYMYLQIWNKQLVAVSNINIKYISCFRNSEFYSGFYSGVNLAIV